MQKSSSYVSNKPELILNYSSLPNYATETKPHAQIDHSMTTSTLCIDDPEEEFDLPVHILKIKSDVQSYTDAMLFWLQRL